MEFIERGRENYSMLQFLDRYMTGHKGFICGGCFKNIFNGEKIKDIDVFFQSTSDFEAAKEYFDKESGDKNSTISFYYENENVKAYKDTKTGVAVELCCKIFGTPKEILEQFDFTIVKFAYFKAYVDDEPDPLDGEVKGRHIEYKVLMHPDFFEHLHTKRLVIDDAIPFPMSTLERMLRYAKYGYMPCRETKIKIARAINALSQQAVEVSESLYDGMD